LGSTMEAKTSFSLAGVPGNMVDTRMKKPIQFFA
jgi:hypothetical protein